MEQMLWRHFATRYTAQKSISGVSKSATSQLVNKARTRFTFQAPTSKGGLTRGLRHIRGFRSLKADVD